MAPAAPGLFSTSTCWPHRSPNFAATMRAIRSELPPGGYATMSFTGRAGHCCAAATVTRQQSRTSRAARFMGLLRARAASLAQPLVGLDARFLDELGVLLELTVDHRLEVRDRHRQRVGAELLDLRRDLRRLDEPSDLLVQALDDRPRRLR